jgi:hypothetical protein
LRDHGSCEEQHDTTRAAVISVHDAGAAGVIGDLTRLRREFYGCLHRRADVLFELTDAVLCADGR